MSEIERYVEDMERVMKLKMKMAAMDIVVSIVMLGILGFIGWLIKRRLR